MKNYLISSLIVLLLFCLVPPNSFSAGNGAQNKKEKEYERSFFKDTLMINYFLWGGRILYVRNKDSKIFDTSLKKWGDNITNPEWNDGDSFLTNYVYHPYFGALYYQVYRDLGYKKEEAYLGTLIQSTLWEFTIEGTVEKPSLIDMVVTPGLGIPLGVFFEDINKSLSHSESTFKRTLSYVVNPTKIFLSEGDFGFFNPLGGNFVIYKPFDYDEGSVEREALNSESFDGNLLPIHRVGLKSLYYDVKQSKGGGSDIFYFLDVDFANSSESFGLNLSIPWAGAYDGNDKHYKVVDNGFEIGNLKFKFNKVLKKEEDFFFGSSLSANLPSSEIWGDKKNRLSKLYSNSSMLKYVLNNATVITPMVYAGNKIVNFSFSPELFFNASDYSLDNEELFLVYGSNLRLFESKNRRVSFGLDLKGIDKRTERDSSFDTTAGFNFIYKNKIELKVGAVKIISGDFSKYAHNGIVADLRIPFK